MIRSGAPAASGSHCQSQSFVYLWFTCRTLILLFWSCSFSYIWKQKTGIYLTLCLGTSWIMTRSLTVGMQSLFFVRLHNFLQPVLFNVAYSLYVIIGNKWQHNIISPNSIWLHLNYSSILWLSSDTTIAIWLGLRPPDLGMSLYAVLYCLHNRQCCMSLTFSGAVTR